MLKSRSYCALCLLLCPTARPSFALNGLPELLVDNKYASPSDPSENLDHQVATLCIAPFGVLRHLELVADDSVLWAMKGKDVLNCWGSEQDIQQLVIAALHDALSASALERKLHCFNELSVFQLEADIWVVMTATGVPVGVCEVKKPGANIMESNIVHGQIYD